MALLFYFELADSLDTAIFGLHSNIRKHLYFSYKAAFANAIFKYISPEFGRMPAKKETGR